jgi:hypothetical protein
MAITGFGYAATSSKTRRPVIVSRCSSGVRSANSPMSAPATNAFSPAPVSTSTRTPSSSRSASSAAISSARTRPFSALRFSGRSMVRTATAPSRSRRSVS